MVEASHRGCLVVGGLKIERWAPGGADLVWAPPSPNQPASPPTPFQTAQSHRRWGALQMPDQASMRSTRDAIAGGEERVASLHSSTEPRGLMVRILHTHALTSMPLLDSARDFDPSYAGSIAFPPHSSCHPAHLKFQIKLTKSERIP